MVEDLYTQILNSYGNPWLICPSPLLSCLLEGCVDCGMDMTNGGSRYYILYMQKIFSWRIFLERYVPINPHTTSWRVYLMQLVKLNLVTFCRNTKCEPLTKFLASENYLS